MKLNFKYRKIIHFTLISSIVLFQVLLVILFYNEIYNEEKLDKIANELENVKKIKQVLQRTKTNHSNAQASFHDFVTHQNKPFLNLYKDNVDVLIKSIDTVSNYAHSSKTFETFNPKSIAFQTNLKSDIDSLRQIKLPSNYNLNLANFQVKPFDYKEVLNSIQVETTKEVDTVKKKGFFSRIGSALAGKSDVQKEKVNILITMKFGKDVTTGDVSQQIAKAFQNTNDYYENEFSKLKKALSTFKSKEAQYAALNLKLLDYSSSLLQSYEQSLNDFSQAVSERYDKQYRTNKEIRYYTIIGLAVLVLIISLILFYFTRLAFVYESKLFKAQKQITQNLNFKNRIVSMISHEIRSPISIISIYSQYLSSKIKEPEIKEVFQSLQFTTNSLNILSSQILDYSKNENKELQLNYTSFDLAFEILEIAKSLETLVKSNGNSLKLDSNISKNTIVNSDIVKMHQLLYNTVGNSNKFTKNGTIYLRFNLNEEKNNLYRLNVEIEDTGAGISKTDLEHIFSNFYQSVVEEKVHNFGAGLGLNLCKEIVQLFDGKIKVDSELGKGTIISFYLFLKK